MLMFAARRLLQAVPILFGVSLIVFGLVQLLPGNPVEMMLPAEAPAAVIARVTAEFGFNQPLPVQYLKWLMQVLHGNLGVSVYTAEPIAPDLFNALGNTLPLAVMATAIGCGGGTALGLLAAFGRGRWSDKLCLSFATAGVSVPHYWFGMVLVIVFSVLLNWLPAQGQGAGGPLWGGEQLRHMILPAVTLSLIPMGTIARLVRATTLDVLSREFVDALLARGLSRRRVTLHVVKNAAPSVVALFGLQIGYLLGGSILVETVFNWPGSGSFLSQAIFRHDIPVLQATILVLAAIFVALNLAADILQALLDPRLRQR